MAYTIRNTRGDTLKTIADGTLDSTLPIKLYGKNYLGYGEGLQNNLIAILENFTKDTEPSAPLKGQLWYDNANLDLKVYNGTAFVQAIKTVSNLAAGNISVTSNITVANINFTTAMTGPQLVSNIATGTAPISVNSTTQVPNLNVAVAGNLINGNSNVIVNANSYVTISVGGTANVVNVATDSMTITGNITANIANLTTINSGLLQNGNSNVTITANANVTITSKSNATVVITDTGANIAGTANITGNANVGNLGATTVIATTANLTTINSGLLKNGTSNVTVNSNGNVNISVGGNVLTVTSTGANIAGTANISGLVSAGSITAANIADVTGTNSALRVLSPGGASYATNTSTVTGAIKIKLPTASNNSNTMLRFRVTIYEYSSAATGIGTSRTFEIGGYNFSSPANTWVNCFATQLTAGGGDLNVRWGGDATSQAVWIGETSTVWNYPQVFVTDFQAGYNLYTQAIWGSGWTVTFPTSFDTVTVGPIVSARVFHGSANSIPAANATYTLGNTTNRFSNIWGVSSSALYADLAEKYRSDADYEPGTVLQIGGQHEITVCNTPRSDRVFGCVSTDPAYLMNDSERDGIWLPVVLTGRAPIRVRGQVRKGDRLVSAGDGAAMSTGTFGSSYQIEIGRALEDKTTEEIGLIEAYISTK